MVKKELWGKKKKQKTEDTVMVSFFDLQVFLETITTVTADSFF